MSLPTIWSSSSGKARVVDVSYVLDSESCRDLLGATAFKKTRNGVLFMSRSLKNVEFEANIARWSLKIRLSNIISKSLYSPVLRLLVEVEVSFNSKNGSYLPCYASGHGL